MTVPLNQTMANDTIYLVNYDNTPSGMCIYNNKAWSVDGEKPDQVAFVSAPGNLVNWEGAVVTGDLWIPFATTIAAGSFDQPAGTQVGTARQYRPSTPLPPFLVNVPNARAWSVYNIFRDNGRVLYSHPQLGNAISLYVCVDSGNFAAEGAPL